jgi:hypothetical protein
MSIWVLRRISSATPCKSRIGVERSTRLPYKSGGLGIGSTVHTRSNREICPPVDFVSVMVNGTYHFAFLGSLLSAHPFRCVALREVNGQTPNRQRAGKTPFAK